MSGPRSPEQLHLAFLDAFNRHDLDAIAALYEPDAILVRGDGAVRGRAAIRDAFRGILGLHPTMTLRTIGVHRCGELALLHGAWTWHASPPDGGEIRREGRSTEVVRRQVDGRWLYVIDNPTAP